ncbi:MAG: hypothetical protein AAFQ68_25020 [Bacteroidota bacterium]
MKESGLVTERRIKMFVSAKDFTLFRTMALMLKLQLLDKESSQPELELEPDWWPVREVLGRFAFEPLRGTGDFIQHYLLSDQELVDLHLDYLQRSKHGPYSFQSWRDVIDPKLLILQDIIEGHLSFHRLRLEVREWESGY